MGCRCIHSQDSDNTSPWNQTLKDYQELEGQEVGEGVKRTKAWTASISSLELYKLREQFWSSRNTGTHQSWMSLKQAAEADAGSAALILELAGLFVENGSMTVCYDNLGNRYTIPIFVLNDPSALKSGVQFNTTEGDNLSIKIREAGKDVDLDIRNTESVLALKQIYGKRNVRLFFGGKEMQDNRPLWTYGLEDGMVIQVFSTSNQK